MKTNKSFLKRIKITSSGKLRSRKPGGSHFNAKESREKQLSRAVPQAFEISNRSRRRFLPGS